MISEQLWNLYCQTCGDYLCKRKTRGIVTKKAIMHPASHSLDREMV